MTPTAITLIFFSVIVHAWWNLRGAREPSASFFLVACATATIFLLPALIASREVIPLIPTRVWILVVLTGVCQMVYFASLAGAYRHGHMSVAYPLARAVPVVVIVLISIALGRGERIGAIAFAGMILVSIGCLMVPMRHLRDLRVANYANLSCGLALLTALGTVGYTMIDDEAQRLLRSTAALALTPTRVTVVYLPLQAMSATLALTCFALVSRTERGRLAGVLRAGKRSAAVTGIMIMSTYGLVLASMAYVTDVSYVAAFRQLSIPIGALMGVVVLREPAVWAKAIGLAVMGAGLVMVGLG